MGGDAVGDAQEPRQPQRVERGAGREVRVEVLVTAACCTPRRGRQAAQRPHRLVPPPAPAVEQVAQAPDWVAGGEPGRVEGLPPGPVLREIRGLDSLGRWVGPLGAVAGLHPHLVA